MSGMYGKEPQGRGTPSQYRVRTVPSNVEDGQVPEKAPSFERSNGSGGRATGLPHAIAYHCPEEAVDASGSSAGERGSIRRAHPDNGGMLTPVGVDLSDDDAQGATTLSGYTSASTVNVEQLEDRGRGRPRRSSFAIEARRSGVRIAEVQARWPGLA